MHMKYIPPQKFNDKLGLSCAKLSSAEATSYQLASKMQLIVSYFFCGWVGGWVVGVETDINANSAPNRVGVGARAELGKMKIYLNLVPKTN